MSEFQGCPGSRMMAFDRSAPATDASPAEIPSQLRQWPIQLHLVPPTAPYYQNADVLLTADCVAYSLGDFHQRFLKDKALAIACPKLDSGQDIYLKKIKSLITDAQISSLTVLIMEVPCCMGLLSMAKQAVEDTQSKVPFHFTVVGIRGDILRSE